MPQSIVLFVFVLIAYQPYWVNTKSILLEEQLWYYLTYCWEDKEVHTFPKGICPNVNVIARLEFELTYYDSAVQHINHYISLLFLLLARYQPERTVNRIYEAGIYALIRRWNIAIERISVYVEK